MDGSESYGPLLPPGFGKDKKSDGKDSDVKPGAIGPALPPGFSKDSTGPENDSKGNTFGPALPPSVTSHVPETSEKQCQGFIGPLVPTCLSNMEGREPVLDTQSNTIGPALPPGFSVQQSTESDEDDADVIGPMPHAGPSCVLAEHEIDARARKMKDKITNKNKPEKGLQRESWMTEIPAELGQNFGIASITSRKLGSGKAKVDTSAWTETPAEREKREQEEKEGKRRKRRPEEEEVHHVSKRDKELAKQVEEHNKSKRSESLLEMHTRKLKKEKKKKKKKDKEKGKSDKPERKPFNRDEDLKISHMDTAQRKSMIKRSQQLNSKFSHGSKQFI